ncbi:hypothetical protein Enr8_08630 [Blastopirellula retiformator]|uniref:Uncharacterized protein n=1 Tax=Blastopirellula retiformator TaxID=2527970 RepID=A0A5C5VM91_9BACT|nr:hypothetical protein Enr8_08630 [Blastopirellula retiformator]
MPLPIAIGELGHFLEKQVTCRNDSIEYALCSPMLTACGKTTCERAHKEWPLVNSECSSEVGDPISRLPRC